MFNVGTNNRLPIEMQHNQYIKVSNFIHASYLFIFLQSPFHSISLTICCPSLKFIREKNVSFVLSCNNLYNFPSQVYNKVAHFFK